MGAFLRLILCFLPAAQLCTADDGWSCVKTRNFEVIGNRDKAFQIATMLQKLRAPLTATTPFAPSAASDFVTTVFLIKSDQMYSDLHPDPNATAFTVVSADQHDIVVGPEGDYPEVIKHEYIHILAHKKFAHLPLWVDEGLAELYSTVSIERGVLMVGSPVKDRLTLLRRRGLIYSLDVLFRLDRQSCFGSRAYCDLNVLYSESWLLLHMLTFDPRYRNGVNQFLGAITAGVPISDAMKTVWQKPAAAVESDLRYYLHRQHFSAVQSSPSPPPTDFQRVTSMNLSMAQVASAISEVSNCRRPFERTTKTDDQVSYAAGTFPPPQTLLPAAHLSLARAVDNFIGQISVERSELHETDMLRPGVQSASSANLLSTKPSLSKFLLRDLVGGCWPADEMIRGCYTDLMQEALYALKSESVRFFTYSQLTTVPTVVFVKRAPNETAFHMLDGANMDRPHSTMQIWVAASTGAILRIDRIVDSSSLESGISLRTEALLFDNLRFEAGIIRLPTSAIRSVSYSETKRHAWLETTFDYRNATQNSKRN